VSDLTDLTGRELAEVRELFKLLVDEIEESCDASRLIGVIPYLNVLD
jgi:hypothetical protein